ncbi:MAG: antitoxin [Verrucomicrobiota bacterium]
MKTTLELPGDLVREIKLRAVHDGRKIKDTVADLLRRGLAVQAAKAPAKPRRVKLPLIQGRKTAVLTPGQIADMLNRQDLEWHQ